MYRDISIPKEQKKMTTSRFPRLEIWATLSQYLAHGDFFGGGEGNEQVFTWKMILHAQPELLQFKSGHDFESLGVSALCTFCIDHSH